VEYTRYVDYKQVLDCEKAAVILPLKVLVLDPAKLPGQAEQLEEHSEAATAYFLGEPATQHLGPESASEKLLKMALATTTPLHFLVVQKYGWYSQVAQAD
jgi:hypothetical protein